LAEDDQAVVVLAHAELAVAEFVQRHVHLGDLAGHHVVAGDQLVALQFERAHGLAARQDREALRLDELAGFVEQRVQDAGLDGVGVLLDVDQGRVAALVALPQFELVAAEGQARGRQRPVQRAGGHRDRPPAAVDQVAEELGHLGVGPATVLARAEQFGTEAAQHPADQGRALFHDAQGIGLGFRDGGAGALRRLQGAAHARDVGPVDQRQVELVAHHPALAELGLVGLGQVAREAGLRRVLQAVADDAVQAVGPHRPLAAGQVAQQAAQRLVPLADLVLVGALEGHAVEPPDAQVVAAARDHVVRADQRRERDEARQRVLRLGLRPVPGPEAAAARPRVGAVGLRHAKHRGLPGRGWARSCAHARSGGCGRAGAASWRRTSGGSAGRPWR
jgi:hypothetical protein